MIPDDKSTGRQRIDVFGAALVTASAAALIYGLSSGQQQGFGSLGTVMALVAAVLLALVFVLVERTTTAPMVPFSYFSSATHRAAVGAMLLMGAVLTAYVYFTSLYMQRVLGESALLAGLSLIPSTATVILTSTFATRRLLARLGVKRMLLIGLASMGVGQVWLSFMTSGGSYVVNVLPGLLLTALGIALALPAASIGATTASIGASKVWPVACSQPGSRWARRSDSPSWPLSPLPTRGRQVRSLRDMVSPTSSPLGSS